MDAREAEARKMSLAWTLQEIRDTALNLLGEVSKDSFNWSEELYAQVRELRDRIVRL